jgi:hypothetical protein
MVLLLLVLGCDKLSLIDQMYSTSFLSSYPPFLFAIFEYSKCKPRYSVIILAKFIPVSKAMIRDEESQIE